MEDQLTDKTGQHLIFIVFSLLDLHNVVQVCFQRSLGGRLELIRKNFLGIYEVIDDIFKLLETPTYFERVIYGLVVLLLLKFFEELPECVLLLP